jgi:uncharacterized phiE125 gp8 family phage protein
MMLSETSQTPNASLPIAALKDHLRLGTGFGTEGLQDAQLEAHLRAAIAAIEARIGKVLITRSYVLTLQNWRSLSQQSLPLAPVTAVARVSVFDGAGTEVVVPPARYRVQADMHRPKLVSVGVLLPSVPHDGRIEIAFDAGFGLSWGDVPPDLAHAVMLLGAQYYETRYDAGSGQGFGLPMTVQSLIERYRTVRILGGSAT